MEGREDRWAPEGAGHRELANTTIITGLPAVANVCCNKVGTISVLSAGKASSHYPDPRNHPLVQDVRHQVTVKQEAGSSLSGAALMSSRRKQKEKKE